MYRSWSGRAQWVMMSNGVPSACTTCLYCVASACSASPIKTITPRTLPRTNQPGIIVNIPKMCQYEPPELRRYSCGHQNTPKFVETCLYVNHLYEIRLGRQPIPLCSAAIGEPIRSECPTCQLSRRSTGWTWIRRSTRDTPDATAEEGSDDGAEMRSGRGRSR